MPCRRRCAGLARPRGGGRVGEGEQRAPRRLCPTRATDRALGLGARRGDGCPRVRCVRAGQARPRTHRHGRHPAVHGGDPHRGPAGGRAGLCPDLLGHPLVQPAVLCPDLLDQRVAEQVRAQYRWLVVDEFQDVNPLQHALLDLWLGDRHDVCVVGDPRQTIYSFAGASPDYLTGFPRRHPDARRVELVRNYRSTPQVVAAANTLFTAERLHEGGGLRAQRDDGPAGEYAGHSDAGPEADAIAERIDKLRASGTPLREMAILFRINAQSEAYEEALAARDIAYVVRGVERFFERPEVKQAITLLRGAARAGDEEGNDLVASTVAILSTMGYTEHPPNAAGAVRDRWESLHALVTMADELAHESGGRSEEHTSELQSRGHLVCRLLLEKKKNKS